jgi:tetratricopeptide (TPR) repeat protein
MSRRDKRRSAAAPRGKPEPRSKPEPPPAGPPEHRTALVVLAVTLALLVVLRGLLPFVPGMGLWSLNLHRFVAPGIGWSLWALAALALLPPFGRRLLPWWETMGRAIEHRLALSMTVAALFGAALVWVFPDRVRFVGDFLLRQGTVEVAERPSVLFPQALPLDIWLHYTLPSTLASSGWMDANGAARLLGAIEAAALGVLAVSLARALALRGAAAVAAADALFFGGYLGMYTGFSKAFAELCLLMACMAVFGLRVIREGRGLLALGLTLAIGVTLHRSALGFLPAAVLVWTLWLRAHARDQAWRTPEAIAGLGVPLIALAIMVPHIVAIVRRWDTVHFASSTVTAQGGVFAAALHGTRALDLLNLVLLISPLALLIPGLAVTLGRRVYQGLAASEAALLWTLALPFVVVMPLLHPVQGMVRDWDDFAATGVAISLLVAWYAGRALRGAGGMLWLAAAVSLGAAAPAVEWLAHNADQERGFVRVRALLTEPPLREKSERGNTWDYLGIRYFRLERWDLAAEALSNAAETSPSPRILQEWALTETMRGRLTDAMALYHRMLEKSPANPLGWLGLATVAFRAGDMREAARAAHELQRIQPGNPDAQRVLDAIAQRGLAPDSSRAAVPGAGRP